VAIVRARLLKLAVLLVVAVSLGWASGCASVPEPMTVRASAAQVDNIKFLVSDSSHRYIVQCDRSGPGGELHNCRYLSITFIAE